MNNKERDSIDFGRRSSSSLFPFNMKEANKPDGYNDKISQMAHENQNNNSASAKNHAKKLSQIEFKWGLFDHKRLYHNKEKAWLFEDDQKDGVLYQSDDSSVDSMDMPIYNDNNNGINMFNSHHRNPSQSKFDKFTLSRVATPAKLVDVSENSPSLANAEIIKEPGAAPATPGAPDPDADVTVNTSNQQQGKQGQAQGQQDEPPHGRGLSLDLIADEENTPSKIVRQGTVEDGVELEFGGISPMSNSFHDIHSGAIGTEKLSLVDKLINGDVNEINENNEIDTPTLSKAQMKSLQNKNSIISNNSTQAQAANNSGKQNKDDSSEKTPNTTRTVGTTDGSTTGGGDYWDIEYYDYYDTEWDPFGYAMANHTQFYTVNDIQKRQYKRDKEYAKQSKELYSEYKRHLAKKLKKQRRKNDPKYIRRRERRLARQREERMRGAGHGRNASNLSISLNDQAGTA